MMVWKKRQTIQAMQVRAVAQSALGGKEAEKAYKEFVAELANVSPESKSDNLRNKLENMKQIHAIKVKPLDSMSNRNLNKVKR